jgi:NADPH:quinone reductase-like Zn-dependent oxidoreductase
MKAMQLVQSAGATMLQQAMVPDPVTGPGDVLVRVLTAGVTPTELGWYPTLHNKDGSPRANAIPGHEFSGVVTAVGAQVTAFRPGNAVYGMNDWFLDGATADLCLTTPEALAPKPDSLSHEEAATVPIAALTAWQGLVDRAKLREGERVLIHGGAGSVGGFAVQIAALHKAHVITTVAASAMEYVRGLGAAEIVEYRTQRFEECVGPLDVVFDTVGSDTLARSWQRLKPSGRLVTIASDAEQSSDPRVKEAFFIVEPRGDELRNISALLDSQQLRTAVKAVVPFAKASTAYHQPFQGSGKVVVRIES